MASVDLAVSVFDLKKYPSKNPSKCKAKTNYAI